MEITKIMEELEEMNANELIEKLARNEVLYQVLYKIEEMKIDEEIKSEIKKEIEKMLK